MRQILLDLRQRRLWPVAVALALTLVAIPALLSTTTKSTPVAQLPHASPSVVPPATAVPAVSVESMPALSRLKGAAHDPFTQQALAAPTLAAGVAKSVSPSGSAGGKSTGSGTSTGSSSGSASAGGSASTGTSGGGSETSGVPSKVVYFHYSVDLTFGRAGDDLRTYPNAKHFTPLPSARNPVLLFLGLGSDAKTAVFLVSSTASVTGDGKCVPSTRNCTFLDLKVGHQELILAQDSNGGVSEYDLAVTAVHLVQDPSLARARLARARVSTAGRKILARARRASPWLRAPSYDAYTGLLSVPGPTLVHLGRLPATLAGVMLGPAATAPW